MCYINNSVVKVSLQNTTVELYGLPADIKYCENMQLKNMQGIKRLLNIR